MEKINEYLNQCFAPYVMSTELENLKEEILANATDHYNDLLSQGKSAAEAEETVLASLGDIKGLLQEIGAPKKEAFRSAQFTLDKDVIRDFADSVTGIFTRALDSLGHDGTRTEVYANIEKIEINGVSVDIAVLPSNDELVHVSAEGNQDEISFEVIDDTLIIKEVLSGNLIFRSGMDLALEVPSTLRSMDVQVVSGDLNINSVSLEKLGFQSTSGDLTIRHGSLGTLYMRSLSGDVYARLNDLDSFDAKLASGDVDIKCIYGGEFSAETQSGDIDAEFGETVTSFFSKATSGDVSVKLPRNINTAPNLSSLSGSIDTSLPSYPDGVPVTIRTISGDIKLRRK